ncbi:MAG: hypothetical protein U0R78_00340 [Nocardioidaceae bacterium]
MGGRRLGLAVLLAASALLLGACETRDVADPSPPTPGDCARSGLGARTAAACHGRWVHAARHTFVPQGLALATDGTAFLSGYHAARHGLRFCEVLVVDRRTGRTLTRVTDIRAHGPAGGTVVCRHGGGLAIGPEGLWISQRSRLWLVDPDEIRGGHAATVRVWDMGGRVRASAVVRRGPWLGLVGYADDRAHFTYWVRVADLLTPGVWVVSDRPGETTVVPGRRTRAPLFAQGAAAGPGGVWYVASTSYCGILHSPRGAEIAFVPGAEGIVFEGRRLWVVSESGARPYQRSGDRPLIPTLTSMRLAQLDRSAATGCSWGLGAPAGPADVIGTGRRGQLL